MRITNLFSVGLLVGCGWLTWAYGLDIAQWFALNIVRASPGTVAGMRINDGTFMLVYFGLVAIGMVLLSFVVYPFLDILPTYGINIPFVTRGATTRRMEFFAGLVIVLAAAGAVYWFFLR